VQIATSPPPATDEHVPVTIGFVDGATTRGLIEPLHCWTRSITLWTHASEGTEVELEFPAEEIAFVGFEAVPDESPKLVISKSLADLRVHLMGDRSFRVRVDRADIASPLGFFGVALGPSGPYSELYFFSRAVRAFEDPQPLGRMLVEAGLVSEEQVEDAARAQAEFKRIPLGQILVQHGKLSPLEAERAEGLRAESAMRLGDVLIEQGLVEDHDVQHAVRQQRRLRQLRLGDILVERGLVTEEAVCRTLARKFRLPFVDLDDVELDAEVLAELPEGIAERYGVLPLSSTTQALTVAVADPLGNDHLDVVRRHVKKRILRVLVSGSQLDRELQTVGARAQGSRTHGAAIDDLFRELDSHLREADPEPVEVDEAPVREDDHPVVKLAHQIVEDAVRSGASDVHIEPNGPDQELQVRFRIDGRCQAYLSTRAALRRALVGRYKVMASLDIAERRQPQDGKISLVLDGRKIELRVATIPTLDGDEDVVLRVLAGSEPLPLEQMGFSASNLEGLTRAIRRPYGLVLCVGPTGSGKTTTLHSALGHINDVERKIWTAEDPVEITQPGLRQVQVNRKAGLTFAAALRSFLRADPDVIMIGEMRDLETVSVAVEASLTGHLVFSTLHTNTAPETVTRLLDMGIDPFSFGDSLVAVLAQRLARRLCTHCRSNRPSSATEFQRIAKLYGPDDLEKHLGIQKRSDLKLWRVAGCEHCGGTGYRGRVALHELLLVDDGIRSAIQRKGTASEVRRIARACGMTTLLQDGLAKAIAGDTDLQQVLTVCDR